MSRTNSSSLVSLSTIVRTCRPSRRMVTSSQIAKTSRIRWEM